MGGYLFILGMLAGAGLVAAFIILYRRNGNRELQQVTAQLQRIGSGASRERVMLLTGQSDMRMLLQAINALIDRHEQTAVAFVRMEQDMRRMLSNVSHDLKTPLTVVRGYIEMLQQPGHAQSERERWIATIGRKATDMSKLLDSFFDLAKLESGDTPINLQPMSLNERCRQEVLACYDRVIAQGLDMEVDVPVQPIRVLANEQALSRILHNLLENALRYGRDGRRIGLRLSVNQEDGQACIEVWDEGKGIPEPLWERVFDRLYTLDDARNADFQGSGLGLTIARHLTEAMHGTIHLHSIPGVRTSFYVKMPLAASDERRVRNL